MTITTDFECGAAKRLTQVGDDHWRLEANGDGSGYDKFFCVRVKSAADEPATVIRLEVRPDQDLGDAGARFFASHFPSDIWYTPTGNWRRWVPLRNTWENALAFHESGFELRIPVQPGTDIVVAANPVLRYSDLVSWVDAVRSRHGPRLEVGSVGKSVDGRDIPLLRLRQTERNQPKWLVFAAQHPSEHGGNWACQGIVEYLLSSIREARDIVDTFDLAIIPMINPDGNVRGLSGANAEGVNMFSDFTGAAEGALPEATENRLFWQWLCDQFPPDVVLHFHGYMGRRAFSDRPGDGLYHLTDSDSLYAEPQRLAAYRAIQERLVFETPAFTASWTPGQLGEESIDHQLAAKFGTLSAFYEINTSAVGQFGQFRRGPEVLTAVARALLRDTSLFSP